MFYGGLGIGPIDGVQYAKPNATVAELGHGLPDCGDRHD